MSTSEGIAASCPACRGAAEGTDAITRNTPAATGSAADSAGGTPAATESAASASESTPAVTENETGTERGTPAVTQSVAGTEGGTAAMTKNAAGTAEDTPAMTEGVSITAEDTPPASDASCCRRTRERTHEEYKSLLNRLSRIEGQVRGIRRMLEEDAYCPDILIQVSAANAALNSFSRELLSQHIRTCVKDDILAGHDETIDELIKTLQRMMK